MQTNEVISQVASIFNVLWPAFAIITGLVLGLGLLQLITREIRSAFDYDWSPPTPTKTQEKRKNEDFIGLPEKGETEKPKATAWRLGDDGEMIPDVLKPKNDNMFHQN